MVYDLDRPLERLLLSPARILTLNERVMVAVDHRTAARCLEAFSSSSLNRQEVISTLMSGKMEQDSMRKKNMFGVPLKRGAAMLTDTRRRVGAIKSIKDAQSRLIHGGTSSRVSRPL